MLDIDISEYKTNFLVSCSGGADSIALLHLLSKKTKNIIVAHYDHRWTSSSSQAAKVVEKFCKELNLPFFLGKAQIAGKTSEAEARDIRYAFLLEQAKAHNAKTIFTAHQLDDNIETFFLRMLRGTGLIGLECIRDKRHIQDDIVLARPLLGFEKTMLIDYCQRENLFFYQDPLNKELNIKRNRLRLQILPQFERMQPNYKKQISNLIQIISEQDSFLEYFINNLGLRDYQNYHRFYQEHISIQRLILKEMLEQANIPISFELIDNLRENILQKNKIKINLKENLYFEFNGIYFKIQEEKLEKNTQNIKYIFTLHAGEQAIQINNNTKIIIKQIHEKCENIIKSKNNKLVFVNLSNYLEKKFIFRKREAGDKFKPLNCNYSVKLKDFLINRKLDKDIKDNIMLLTIENSSEILWIANIEISDYIKILPEQRSTHSLEIL